MNNTSHNNHQVREKKGIHIFVRPHHVLVALCIAFIGTLVIASLPHARQTPYQAIEMSQLRQMGLSAITYAYENEDRLPPHPKYLITFVAESYSQKDLFNSPYRSEKIWLEERIAGDGKVVRYGDYVFIDLGMSLNQIPSSTESILAYSAKVSDRQTTRSVLFADGHVEQWPEEQLREALSPDVDVDALDGP